MIRSVLNYIVILLICTIFVSWSFDVYGADKSITINLTNFSEKDYSKYLSPFLPSHGYSFNINHIHTGSIANPAIGTINFYQGNNIIDNKNFFKLSSNAFDNSGNSFMFEWDISKGFFFNNRKKRAFKFTTEMIFDSQDSDVNTAFTNKLLKSDEIININSIFSTGNENITGYEFNYIIQRSPTYRAVRTSIQILSLCSIGIINYFIMKDVNMDDWQYKYRWSDVKPKFFDGWYWDPNNFNTNTLYHLYAGQLYYQIARSNYYSIPASFAWSFGGSLIWEYFGEWREQVSLNDMIFTPTLGSIAGECLVQMANFVEQKMQRSFLRETLLVILDPPGYINKALDSSNSGDMRVRLIFANPVQAAIMNQAR